MSVLIKFYKRVSDDQITHCETNSIVSIISLKYYHDDMFCFFRRDWIISPHSYCVLTVEIFCIIM